MNKKMEVQTKPITRDLSRYLKYMDVVNEYKDELYSLSRSWDNLALLSHIGNNNTNISETKNNFLKLTDTLLDHLAEESLNKVVRQMDFKAQISIDILIRNLFERTADIGFLSTDKDIREFVQNHTNKYDATFDEHASKIKARFKEYTQKYSVYYDIVLMDTHGNILVQMDGDEIRRSEDSLIKEVLSSQEDYIESFKYHDFIPKRERSLVYSSKVLASNDPNAEVLGVLALCFRFKDEMKGIFDNLKNDLNKECLTILDQEGQVIATSDQYHIALGTILEFDINKAYQIVSFAGRDYLCKSCKTNGYQGYMGQKWYGHIMMPLEYAFMFEEESINLNEETLLAILQEGEGFSDELKEIPMIANEIQVNLNRMVWNGNVNKSCEEQNRNLSRALLHEISLTGAKTKDIFDQSIANLTKTIILNNTSYIASLMVDIMDRNLYERANDSRWWALTDHFIKILSSNDLESKNSSKLEEILKYINSLYTVYTNLFVYDANGIIVSVSNDKYKPFIGKKLSANIVDKTKNISDSNDYFVSKFERTKLYDDEYTYVYYASIRNENSCVGGIGVVFDSTVEFDAMLKESIPQFKEENQDKIFGLFTTRDQMIISSSNPKFKIGESLGLDSKFFQLKNGQSHSEIIEYDGNYYAVGIKCSQGYREYKRSDNYSNDVFAIFFSHISNSNLSYESIDKVSNEVQSAIKEDSEEIATFFIGGKWLGFKIDEVLETVSIDKLDLSPTLNNDHYFKGTFIYNEKAVGVIDIKGFIDEPDVAEYKEIIIVKHFDENSDNYIGILVNALGSIPEVERSSIKEIDQFLLGDCTLINAIVSPEQKDKKLLSILDIKTLRANLVDE